MIELMSPRTMAIYAHVCGGILARAHARSGDRIAIAGYLGDGGRFEEAIADFAGAYADQNEADFETLKRAAADGRIAVELTADVGWQTGTPWRCRLVSRKDNTTIRRRLDRVALLRPRRAARRAARADRDNRRR